MINTELFSENEKKNKQTMLNSDKKNYTKNFYNISQLMTNFNRIRIAIFCTSLFSNLCVIIFWVKL